MEAKVTRWGLYKSLKKIGFFDGPERWDMFLIYLAIVIFIWKDYQEIYYKILSGYEPKKRHLYLVKDNKNA